TYVAPRNDKESALCDIWADILQVEQVGIRDNFFASGGDSILSIQVIARARELGIDISMRDMFEGQTIEALTGGEGEASNIKAEQGDVSGEQILLPIQHWFLEGDQIDQHYFHQSTILAVPEGFNTDTLNAILHAMHQRHDALRLRFVSADEGEWQASYQPLTNAMIAQCVEHIPMLVDDNTTAAQREAIQTQMTTFIKGKMDLAQGPLLKAVYFDAPASQDSRLVLVLHHLLVDGVTWRIVLDDMSKALKQWQDKGEIKLAAKSSSYQQWAQALQEYASSDALAQEKAHWLAAMSTKVEPLPQDADHEDNSMATSANVSLALSEQETHQLLRESHGAYETKINDLLLAALQLAFKRWCGRDVLRVRMEGHGREPLFNHIDVSETAGWFTSVFPMLLAGDSTNNNDAEAEDLSALIKGVKNANAAIPNNGIGYGVLRYMAQDEALTAAADAFEFDIAFNYLGQFDQSTQASNSKEVLSDFMPVDEDTGAEISPRRQRPYPMRFNAAVGEGQFGFSMEFNKHRYRPDTMQALAEYYRQALLDIVAHCTGVERAQLSLADFPLVPADQAKLDNWLHQNQHSETQPFFPLKTFKAEGVVNCPVPYSQKMFLHFTKKPSLEPMLRTFRIISLKGDLNIAVFERAYAALVQRHAVFQMRFADYRGHLALQIDPQMQPDFTVVNCPPSGNAEATLRQMMLDEVNRAYDIRNGQFLRCLIIENDALNHDSPDAEKQSYVVLGMNHLVSDRWSWGIFQEELETLYNGAQVKADGDIVLPELTPLAADFPDYCYWNHYWHNTPALQQQMQYWQSVFGDLQWSQAFPTDLEKSDLVPTGGLNRNFDLNIDEALFERIDAYCKAQSITLYTFFMSALHLVLANYADESDIVVVSPKAERDLPELAKSIGLYLNLLPVHSRVDKAKSLASFVKQVADNVVTAQANIDVQIDAVLETLDCDQTLPISDVNFQYYNFAQESGWALDGLQSEAAYFSENEIQYENTLDLRLLREESGVSGVWVYNSSKYRASTMAKLSNWYIAILENILSQPNQTIDDCLLQLNPSN
ncbi:condensation domain-containing protein, partial [Alteromonas sp. a30]|uniref:condensation domain-containing protein n=1 Tax=Alteromonas sp. a30 TaxID=2730917 RepID=UPI0022819679